MSALPAVPAGANRFAIYLDALEAQLYPSLRGSRGFSARAYVLLAVCAYGIIISVAYGAALFWRARRKRKPLWIARKVDGYVTLNLAFFVPAGGAVCCAFMLAYTYLQYRLFTLPSHPSSTLYPTNAFRPYCWIPLVLHGYSIAAGSAQACLVVSHRTSALQPARRRSSLLPPAMDCSRLAKPAVVNSLFWTGLVFFLLVLLIPNILFSISWSRSHARIAALESFLVRQSSDPDAGVVELLHLGDLFDAMKGAVASTCRHQQAVVASLIFAPVFLALITALASFLLYRLLRQQIRARNERRSISIGSPILLNCASPVLPAAEGALIIPTETVALNPIEVRLPPLASFVAQDGSPSENKDKSRSSSRPSSGRRPSSLSFSSLPTVPTLARLGSKARGLSADSVMTLGSKSSTSRAADDLEEDYGFGLTVKASRASGRADEALDELKRAKRDLQISAMGVLLLTLALAAENCWNVAYIVPTPYPELSWASVEAAFFLPPWLYASIFSIGPTLLLLSTLAASNTAPFAPTASLAAPAQQDARSSPSHLRWLTKDARSEMAEVRQLPITPLAPVRVSVAVGLA